jgi:hypothetical protein
MSGGDCLIKDGGAGQSFATWLLWAALDTILTVSLFCNTEIISCRSVSPPAASS